MYVCVDASTEIENFSYSDDYNVSTTSGRLRELTCKNKGKDQLVIPKSAYIS